MKKKEIMNFNHLYYFWVTAREGSITRAADTVGISQPSLSAQLQVFSGDMGFELFQRQGRGISLTAKGAQVFGYCNDIFHIAKEIENI